jgi:hypothetical protein
MNGLFNDAVTASEVILSFEERYKDIGCQVCKVLSLKLFRGGGGQLRKSPRKECRRDLFPEPDCVTNIRWAQLKITFSFRKNNGPRKPEMFYITFDCYNLNPARTRTLSVLPGPRPRSVQTSSNWSPEPDKSCSHHPTLFSINIEIYKTIILWNLVSLHMGETQELCAEENIWI